MVNGVGQHLRGEKKDTRDARERPWRGQGVTRGDKGCAGQGGAKRECRGPVGRSIQSISKQYVGWRESPTNGIQAERGGGRCGQEGKRRTA